MERLLRLSLAGLLLVANVLPLLSRVSASNVEQSDVSSGSLGTLWVSRSAEVNRRFARHLGALFRDVIPRRLGDVVGVDDQGASWARRLACQPGCLHGGVCQLDPKTRNPTCLCPLPDEASSGVYYRGSSCQTEAVRCNSTFWCENGGTCDKVQQSSEQQYTCACPRQFRGAKCQTPVTPCGGQDSSLWCANGGSCVFSDEANATICKCPSTHAGTNCETLVEPQELNLAIPHSNQSSFSSPVVLPSDSDIQQLEEEQQQYFKAFFLIFGVFLTIWVTALAVVHCPRPRHELKRRLAALRGELAPLRGKGAGMEGHPMQHGQTGSREVPLLKQHIHIVERLPSRHLPLAQMEKETGQEQSQERLLQDGGMLEQAPTRTASVSGGSPAAAAVLAVEVVPDATETPVGEVQRTGA